MTDEEILARLEACLTIADLQKFLVEYRAYAAKRAEWRQKYKHKFIASVLAVNYDEETNCVFVHDYNSFITSIMTPDSLWEVLKIEAAYPGYAREGLKKKAKTELSAAEARQLLKEWLESHISASKITVEDLDL